MSNACEKRKPSPLAIKHHRWLWCWQRVFAVMLALVVNGTTTAPAQAADGILRLGSWNIEWLGKPGKRSSPGTHVAQKPADLANYIVASQVDILALQEISDNDAVSSTHTNKTLTAALARVTEQTGQTWKHQLFPKAAGHRDQLCGIAWNSQKVILQQEPLKIPLVNSTANCPPHWERHPYATQFSFGPGNTDFVVIVLHMKSNVNGEALGKCRRRGEARTLARALPRVRQTFADQDLVLIGDTNMLNASESAASVFRDAGFHDLNSDDATTRWTGHSPFDRVFTPTGQNEFMPQQQEVFGDGFLAAFGITRAQFKRRFSDHFMVITEVKIVSDDD